jgi:hypothetical protein
MTHIARQDCGCNDACTGPVSGPLRSVFHLLYRDNQECAHCSDSRSGLRAEPHGCQLAWPACGMVNDKCPWTDAALCRPDYLNKYSSTLSQYVRRILLCPIPIHPSYFTSLPPHPQSQASIQALPSSTYSISKLPQCIPGHDRLFAG